jgi:hypothetical protein
MAIEQFLVKVFSTNGKVRMTIEQFLVKVFSINGVESITFISAYYGYIDVRSREGDKGQFQFSLLDKNIDIKIQDIKDFCGV